VLCLCVVLVMNMLVPLATVASDRIDQRFLLCTTSGFKWVDLNENQAPSDTRVMSCALCLSLDDEFDVIRSDGHFSHALELVSIALEVMLPASEIPTFFQPNNPRAPPQEQPSLI